jgi:hypothetical protein
MMSARTLAKAFRMAALGFACGCAALPANALTFKTTFASGYDGWVADFADYQEADSSRRKLEHAIGPIRAIEPSMTALRMTGMPSYVNRADSSGDLFPFIRKRFTGLAPNTEYRITFRLELATAYGQFSRDTLWIKAGATAVEPRKIRGPEAGKILRINIRKGPARGPGADMDTLGRIGYAGTGHSFPEPRSFDNAKRPFRFKSDETGAVWITIGGEYLPLDGVEGLEFNVGTIQIDLEAAPTSLRPGRQVERGRGPEVPMGTFRWGTREWNLAGERIP